MTSRKRGRKAKAEDPRVKELERENAMTSNVAWLGWIRLEIHSKKKPPNYWGSP